MLSPSAANPQVPGSNPVYIKILFLSLILTIGKVLNINIGFNVIYMSAASTLAPTLESRVRELHGGGKTVVQNPPQGPGKKKKA